MQTRSEFVKPAKRTTPAREGICSRLIFCSVVCSRMRVIHTINEPHQRETMKERWEHEVENDQYPCAR